VDDWQENIELMLHELAHSVVRSNDHLVHQLYETVGRLGAKLALLAVEQPSLFEEALRVG
jgi:N-formylglutamate amidohydrolase